MKIMIPLVLFGLTACDPGDGTTAAREDLQRAQEDLAEAKEDAAKQVADAREAEAVEVAEASAEVDRVSDELLRKLDEVDAGIAALESASTTPAQQDEIVAIRERQDLIVLRVRDHDKDGVTWSAIERDVDEALEALGRDIETTRIKVVEKK